MKARYRLNIGLVPVYGSVGRVRDLKMPFTFALTDGKKSRRRVRSDTVKSDPCPGKIDE